MSIKHDRSGVRTAQDLERKYDLSSILGLKIAVEQNNQGLTKIENELTEFTKATLKNLEELQNQVDGNITTWFFSGVPNLENSPASEWTTEEVKINHLGDLYYDKNTGYCYRFTLENDNYKWLKLTDSDITEALALANAAQDVADSKRRVFVVDPTPPYDIGDIWFNNDELYRCQRSKSEKEIFESIDWIIATKYTDDTFAISVKKNLDNFKKLVEKDYVLTKTFDETKEGFKMSVDKLRVLANEKAKVFKNQPVPPYNIGDIYINGTNIYSCITSKKEKEEYSKKDWEININSSDWVTHSDWVLENDKINAKISTLADVTNEQFSNTGKIMFAKVNESEPLAIEIHPTIEDISYLYLLNENNRDGPLYLSEDLFLLSRDLIFKNLDDGSIIKYTIPADLNIYDGIYDEFILNYQEKVCKVIKRVGIDKDGNKYILSEEKIINYEYPNIKLKNGNYEIKLLSFNNAYLKVRLMIQNEFTGLFSSQIQFNALTEQTAKSIGFSVEEFLNGRKLTGASFIVAINEDKGNIKLNADAIDADGLVKFLNSRLKDSGATTINGDNITTGTINADRVSGGTLKGTIIEGNTINGGTINGANISSNVGNLGGWNLNENGLNNGDYYINKNGYSNIYTTSDLLICQMIILNLVPKPEPGSSLFKFYDINNDGKIDAGDLLRLQKMILGEV